MTLLICGDFVLIEKIKKFLTPSLSDRDRRKKSPSTQSKTPIDAKMNKSVLSFHGARNSHGARFSIDKQQSMVEQPTTSMLMGGKKITINQMPNGSQKQFRSVQNSPKKLSPVMSGVRKSMNISIAVVAENNTNSHGHERDNTILSQSSMNSVPQAKKQQISSP